MKTKMTLRKFGLFLLALAVGIPLTVRADSHKDRGDTNQKSNSAKHDHDLSTPLKLIGVVPVPGNPIVSADIAWVDPGTERYYLADRSNAGVDIINVETGFYEARVAGMVGVVGTQDGTTTNNGPGPNGVVVTPGRRLWIGDGNSTLRVADVDPNSATYLTILHSINTAVTDPTSPSYCDSGAPNGHWCGRSDELGYDPKDHLILIANNAPFSPTKVDPILCPAPANPLNHCAVQPYATLVSADPPYAILKVFSFANSGGLEQPVWDPGLGRFWLTVPGAPAGSPTIARIDPITMTVDKTITINCTMPAPAGLGLAANNPSITGIGLAPFEHLLVSACGFPVDVNAISGNAKLITSLIGGGDEVWYNPGDGRFYVTGRDAGNVQQLGVIDAEDDSVIQNIPISGPLPPTGTALTAGRNPAAFSESNRVFVDTPVTAAIVMGTSPDDSVCTKFGVVGRGCIAVYAHAGDEGDEGGK